MIKARHRTLSLTAKEAPLLQNTQREAARCWNDTLALSKTHCESSHVWISKSDLQMALKRQYALHSQTLQGITDKYCDNRKAAAAHRRNGNKKMKPPGGVRASSHTVQAGGHAV